MNYIKHLTAFFDKIIIDTTLNPTHISLYIGLFQYWNVNRFQNPISITRNEIMLISKIASKATYHKCMRELHSKGYIKYEPSYNPFKGSMVILFNLADDAEPVQNSDITPKKISPNNKQAVNQQQTTTSTPHEQALVSSINNTNQVNNTNVINLEEPSKKNKKVKEDLENETGNTKEKKFREKKKTILATSSTAAVPNKNPTLEEVKTHFQENNFPEIEALKFFNYFTSIGWQVGGKTPMQNWKAATQNWMLNHDKFNPAPPQNQNTNKNTNKNQNTNQNANHLTTPPDKDYSEPL